MIFVETGILKFSDDARMYRGGSRLYVHVHDNLLTQSSRT